MKIAVSTVAASAALLVLATDFEPAPRLSAKDVVPATRLKSAAYTIDDVVPNDGFLNTYTIRTPFGAFEAQGDVLLDMRLDEAEALAKLDEVSKTGVLAKALGRSVVNTGRGVVQFVTKPVDTLKGVGGGLKRFGVNLGRKGKRAADKAVDAVQGDEADGEDPEAPKGEKSTGAKVGGAAGGAAKAILGVNSARRRWAAKVGVDPYTTNELVQRTLEEIAKVDAAGSVVARVAIPIPLAVGTTATISGLVWSKDPEELLKLNESSLKAMGVPDAGVKEFLYGNDAYTLTTCTIIAQALHAATGVEGRAAFVETATGATTEAEAWFYATSAQLLQRLAVETPVASLLGDSHATVARTKDGRAVVLLPADYITWNEQVGGSAPGIAQRSREEMQATALELRTTGRVSPRTRQELTALGFAIREGYRPNYRPKPST